MNQRKIRRFWRNHKRKIAAFLIASIVLLTTMLGNQDIGGINGQKVMENIPVVVPLEETYIIPNPCTLTSVVCEGEEEPEIYTAIVTAYTSHVEQTDDMPCLAADGSNICFRYEEGEHICATNDYPFGTRLYVEGYGTCTVADRMNSRYTGTGRVDIYLGYDLEAAFDWGVRSVKITVN